VSDAMPVEQIKLRRAGTGLRAWDRERAWPGYTLFAPYQSEDTTVYLIDLDGTPVHTWRMPYPAQYGCLTERGTLLYNGRTPGELHTFLSDKPYKIGAVLEADWSGRVLWEVRHRDHHHDGILLQNGNVMLLTLMKLPRQLVSKIKGGMPGTEHNGDMYGDHLAEMTTDGRLLREYRLWEQLDPETDRITAIQEPRDVWSNGNGLAELPNGDIVVSFRTISTVAIVDRQIGTIVWKLGAPPLCGQHAPTPLPNGNLLVFDNGPHRLDHPIPFSRVIEVNPKTRKIIWEYRERRESDFFSPRISNAQRLPNGNTLICEGDSGRLFEVTAGGELVWEYVNPYFGGAPINNRVFRAYRYSAEEIARARATGHAP
jgi:Arylsulfotransferase (ASST)